MIALKPPKYTKVCCFGRVPVEKSYTDHMGTERKYVRHEKDECPYHTRAPQDKYGYTNTYICGLFGGKIGYKGYRLETCKYVFGKSKKMIKNWRPIRGIEMYLRVLAAKRQERNIERLFRDGHIGKREKNRGLKVLNTWLLGTAPTVDLDPLIKASLVRPDKKTSEQLGMHMGSPTTPGGTMLYA